MSRIALYRTKIRQAWASGRLRERAGQSLVVSFIVFADHRLASGHHRNRPKPLASLWPSSSRIACRIATTWLIVASLLAPGCSQHSPTITPAPPPASETELNSRWLPTPGMATGIIVEKWQPQSLIIGTIDPLTGAYRHYVTFAASVDKFDPRSAGPDYKLSQDFTRYSLTLSSERPGGSNRVGWVDRKGTFTEVNTTTPQSVPFDGPAPYFDDIGFDRAGNFYYLATYFGPNLYNPKITGGQDMIEVPNGATQGGQPLRDRTPIGNGDSGTYWEFDGNGEMQVYGAGCGQSGNWLNPDEFLTVGDISASASTQLYKAKVCGADRVPLLPATYDSVILNPVASPDGSQVAFKRGTQELWIVDATGSGSPRKLNLTGINLAEYRVIRWK